MAGLTMDRAGNLYFHQPGKVYGTTFSGGNYNNDGVVYELTKAGNTWTENPIRVLRRGRT